MPAARARALAAVAALAALALAAATHAQAQARAPAPAGIVSSEQIERALAPPAAPAAGAAKTRGLVLRAKTESREVVDLNVPFELDSAVLQPQAVAQLEQLLAALTGSALRDFRFRVAGHTDARGDAGYNRKLSMRRAEAVRRFLVEHGLDGSRLECVGLGEDEPLLPDDPDNAANRRVEIRNLGAAAGP
jgi:outer membrane protein OmpA-like peptidoglycan-associated protein